MSSLSDVFPSGVFPTSNNDLVKGGIIILLILYATLMAPRLPLCLARILDYTLVQIALLLLIVYATRQDPAIGVIAAVALLVSLISLNNYKHLRTEAMTVPEYSPAWTLEDPEGQVGQEGWYVPGADGADGAYVADGADGAYVADGAYGADGADGPYGADDGVMELDVDVGQEVQMEELAGAIPQYEDQGVSALYEIEAPALALAQEPSRQAVHYRQLSGPCDRISDESHFTKLSLQELQETYRPQVTVPRQIPEAISPTAYGYADV